MIRKLIQLFAAGMAVITNASAFADDPHHPHRFSRDVDALHAVLAPVWHAPQGSERLQIACAKTGEMERLAINIRSADASRVVESLKTLKTRCQDNQAAVEAALGDVHDAFHHLVEHGPAGKSR